jgi:hypothetical protein
MEPPTLELPSSVHTSRIELGTFEIFHDFSAWNTMRSQSRCRSDIYHYPSRPNPHHIHIYLLKSSNLREGWQAYDQGNSQN